MFFDDDGVRKLAFETGTDWVDFEDSELIGESETIVRAWGIPITEAQAKNGTSRDLQLNVSDDGDDGAVSAWFFASVGHRVDHIKVEFPGKMRIRLAMHIEDITEETDECNTVITVDTILSTKADLNRPE